MEIRTQKIELNPNNKQSTLMAQHAGYSRVAYNFALSSFKTGLDRDEWRTYVDIKREFNAVKYDKFDWCEDLSQNASKNAIHNLGDAVMRWKNGENKFPVYKHRSGRISYQADNGAGTVEVYKKRIKLPKIGWIRMSEELRFTGEVAKVVVSQRNNRWFVSILVRCDANNYQYQPSLFDDKEPNRIACVREDAHHKASTAIVKRAAAIGIETLNISGLLRNRNIAKALSDSALSRFLTMLKYKAERRGIPIIQADRFFASSKTCSNCGHKKDDLTLSDRTYQCGACGFECDRDLNAAINLSPT